MTVPKTITDVELTCLLVAAGLFIAATICAALRKKKSCKCDPAQPCACRTGEDQDVDDDASKSVKLLLDTQNLTYMGRPCTIKEIDIYEESTVVSVNTAKGEAVLIRQISLSDLTEENVRG